VRSFRTYRSASFGICSRAKTRKKGQYQGASAAHDVRLARPVVGQEFVAKSMPLVSQMHDTSAFSKSIHDRIIDVKNGKLSTNDIYSRWGKITEVDAVKVKSQGDLTNLVAKAYNLDQAEADAAVTSWMAGRSF